MINPFIRKAIVWCGHSYALSGVKRGSLDESRCSSSWIAGLGDESYSCCTFTQFIIVVFQNKPRYISWSPQGLKKLTRIVEHIPPSLPIQWLGTLSCKLTRAHLSHSENSKKRSFWGILVSDWCPNMPISWLTSRPSTGSMFYVGEFPAWVIDDGLRRLCKANVISPQWHSFVMHDV